MAFNSGFKGLIYLCTFLDTKNDMPQWKVSFFVSNFPKFEVKCDGVGLLSVRVLFRFRVYVRCDIRRGE